MFAYKVDYIYSSKIKGKWWEKKNQVDGLILAKELEALLLERNEQGYELENVTPIITSNIVNGTHPMSRTDGLIVTFRMSSQVSKSL